ncbi:hypothetical protein QQP08_012041 [Theobroma cacao]|nr:hypothetical protein QQP08_012041 [Theobroma cacao]
MTKDNLVKSSRNAIPMETPSGGEIDASDLEIWRLNFGIFSFFWFLWAIKIWKPIGQYLMTLFSTSSIYLAMVAHDSQMATFCITLGY